MDSSKATQENTSSCCSSACCSGTSSNEPDHTISSPAKATITKDGVRTPIRIMQMDCPTEEGMIRRLFKDIPEVKALDFNLMQRLLTVTHEPEALDKILDGLRSLGFEPEVYEDGTAIGDIEIKHRPWWPIIFAAVIALVAEISRHIAWPLWSTAALAIIAILIGGLHTYKKGWTAIVNGNLNINALMSIAVTGALIIGEWGEAAMVMVLFSLAEVIEARSLDRARQAISSLMALAPKEALVQQDDGQWQIMLAANVAVGRIVRIGPGQHIPLDGEILHGTSSVNQAPITGESMPLEKQIGDPVYAGTINLNGSFDYRVTARANDTVLARIIHQVEEAQKSKAPMQRFIDRFASIYTPAVLVLALFIAVVPPLFFGGAWLDWLYKALVMLVIACPCALVISTPVTIVSALTSAARHGILIKGGVYLENARLLKNITFDKTGTLTESKTCLEEAIFFDESQRSSTQQIAVNIAARSDHPISVALVNALNSHVNTTAIEQFEALPGRGTKAVIQGANYYLGSHRLIQELGLSSETLEAQLSAFEQAGKNTTLLCNESDVLALFIFSDQIKASSRNALQELQAMGLNTLMLSGDNQQAVDFIAKEVGIKTAYGELLPDAKLEFIDKLSKEGLVAMVGDGINDAPALARADIGIAMGVIGSDAALETADIALMDDDLNKLPALIRLSKKTYRILQQNIVLALSIKVVFLILTLINLGTMWMAVFADMGSSLLVVFNGLRLLRYKPLK